MLNLIAQNFLEEKNEESSKRWSTEVYSQDISSSDGMADRGFLKLIAKIEVSTYTKDPY